ncbi:hypothetical protein JCM19239_528 [Vibrio variabilis]|uniref:DUF4397 domain-containing protein n=1 Tax=Vibrio variabilis TaxID=990271 RepID=A0ABQ0J9Y7_9VIBR|nr:hypothetical protein JCM19239_528 [Vibrio variabilis]
MKSTSLAADTYNIDVVLAANDGEVIPATDITVDTGVTTTIYAAGGTGGASITPILIENDDLRGVAVYAKLRVLHAHPNVGLVDIHAKAQGVGSFDDSTRVLEGVDYTKSAVLNVAGGDYDFAVIAPNDNTFTPVISLSGTLEAGGVYTAYATEDDGILGLSVDTAP